MVQLKDGVHLTGNKYINKILEVVQYVYQLHGWQVFITSGNDGTHGPNSYHPQDRALDIRFWMVPPDQREAIAQEFRNLLPRYYDVVVEEDHYHIESDVNKEFS